MNFTLFKRLSASCALGLALLTGGAAHAGMMTMTVDVTGIASNDGFGAAINETRQIYVGAGSRIVSLGWDVELFADAPSFLSEMAVDMSDGGANGFSLAPLFDVFNPGTQSASGFMDLILGGVDFYVSNTGFLHLEFFELFDDFPNDFDGVWNSGALRIGVVPEPGSMALVALALLAGGAATRRRAKSA